MPKHFSILENAKESYKFIQQVAAALINQNYPKIKLDYSECESVGLATQVFLDIIIKDMIAFYTKCGKYQNIKSKVHEIGVGNFKNQNIKKLLFSVGSPAIISNKSIYFEDIIPYKLCVHNREGSGNPIKNREQKDIDTTTLVDYVLDCLKRFNKTLTSDKLYDLCTVIGEILINAEEHSTTKNRFSIGYYQDINGKDGHSGIFRLVIMNFGKTIYEIFKDPSCPNKGIVEKMRRLSESYNSKKYFFQSRFEEETLWTLYALQEGVTSVAPEKYKKRGNGSIQFIDSFFNIKGRAKEADDVSRMTILSGNTSIVFNGAYNIVEREVEGERFKFMTFNNSGNIEDKPDQKYVKFVDNYFPGTVISAKILFKEDDMTNES